jgi:hypothetical protein
MAKPLTGVAEQRGGTVLFDVHAQQHFRKDMAADLKCTGLGKHHIYCLSRRLLRRIKTHRLRGDVNLVQKFVVIAEGDRVAALDRDDALRKRPMLLRHVQRGGKSGRRDEQQSGSQQLGKTEAAPSHSRRESAVRYG